MGPRTTLKPPKMTGISHHHVRSAEGARDLSDALRSAESFALDCEAAGFHRYSDRLCLVQVTVDDDTWVVDPLAFDIAPIFREALENPRQTVVMHGADFDLRLLRRDLGIRLRGLMDTQVQAALIGEEGLGLAALLEKRMGVRLSKKYQRADWADRPLTEDMLSYAASDTRYLRALTRSLADDVARLERGSWVAEECLALESVADEEPTEAKIDPVVRVKGARDLLPRQVTALRAALAWRDEIAKQRDRALFRVIGDPPLIAAALEGPRRVEDLVSIKGFPKSLAREEGKELLRRLRSVAELPEEELVAYPRNVRRGTGRPPPELETLVDSLKQVRNEAAAEIGLPRGTLLANAVLISIARENPKTLLELQQVPGMRAWKAEVLGERVLERLARG